MCVSAMVSLQKKPKEKDLNFPHLDVLLCMYPNIDM